MQISEEIVARCSAGTFPELIAADFFKRDPGRDQEELATAAISLHNEGVINLLAAALTLPHRQGENYNFFVIQSFYLKVIPALEAEVPAMMAAVRNLVAAGSVDVLAASPTEGYRAWVGKKDHRPLQTLELIAPDAPNDRGFLISALLALGQSAPQEAFDRCVGYLASPTETAQRCAAAAIGHIELPSVPGKPSPILELIRDTIDAGAHTHLVGLLLDAALTSALRSPGDNQEILLAIITSAGSQASDDTIQRCASALAHHAGKLPPAICAALTLVVHKVDGDNSDAIHAIDFAASQLIQHKRLDESLALIEPLLLANLHLHTFEKFDSTKLSLLQLDTNTLGLLAVKWLSSGQPGLTHAVYWLLSRHDGSAAVLKIDFADQNISEAKAGFIARKAIGFLFTHPVTAASIVVSLLRTGPAAATDMLTDLLFEPLLLNYSGGLSDWLKAECSNEMDRATPAIKAALARLQSYLESLNAIVWIPEFAPSEREREIGMQRQQLEMDAVAKAVEEKSVFRSLIPRSLALYGSGLVYHVYDAAGGKTRQVMKFTTMSHSVEPARQSIIEGVEVDYLMKWFRAEPMPQ